MAKINFLHKVSNVAPETIQYIVEMFTTDDDGNEHPENLIIRRTENGRIYFKVNPESEYFDGEIGECSECGEQYAFLFDEHEEAWNMTHCEECGEKFTKLFEMKVYDD